MQTALRFVLAACFATGIFWQAVDAGTPEDKEGRT
jgi:hypothetical protein